MTSQIASSSTSQIASSSTSQLASSSTSQVVAIEDERSTSVPKIVSIEEAKISTKTIVAATNTKFNIYKIFKKLPITPFSLPEKKRGRKRREELDKQVVYQQIPKGSIIYTKYEQESRGTPLKKKSANGKYFGDSYNECGRK